MASVTHDRFDVAGADGAPLPVHRWKPAGARIGFVALHGATSHGGWFATLAEAFGKRGIATYAPDRRGSGHAQKLGLPDEPGVWVDDLRRTLDAIAGEVDQVVLAPWCFAVKLAVPALATGRQVHRMVMLAPSFYFYRDVAAGFKEGLARGDEFAVPVSDDTFVSAPHAIEFLATDPLRWRTMTRQFRQLSGALLETTLQVLPGIKTPMTAVFATGDRVADNVKGAELTKVHHIQTHTIEGSHGFFLDDPERAAATLQPLFT